MTIKPFMSCLDYRILLIIIYTLFVSTVNPPGDLSLWNAKVCEWYLVIVHRSHIHVYSHIHVVVLVYIQCSMYCPSVVSYNCLVFQTIDAYMYLENRILKHWEIIVSKWWGIPRMCYIKLTVCTNELVTHVCLFCLL